ncbi:reverse transcriptase [Plakobranchus ocellatus]|uniref:Reverse transcriptase n=1 Tax=Plakobranchus ocellatus TaxID=259542 RepID=A0AAV4A9W1_9GAST|nr:reverse transcriptase [Plakobranchus ocellatus]
MIQRALTMYYVPEDILAMLEDYFSGFKTRFSTERYTTNWINLEVGIAISCKISPTLFVLAIRRTAEGGASPADLGGGCYMPPLNAFIDDALILCAKENETCRILVRLYVLIIWSRMSFKPKKSRSLSIKKGRLAEGVCI